MPIWPPNIGRRGPFPPESRHCCRRDGICAIRRKRSDPLRSSTRWAVHWSTGGLIRSFLGGLSSTKKSGRRLATLLIACLISTAYQVFGSSRWRTNCAVAPRPRLIGRQRLMAPAGIAFPKAYD
ncbi:hypothetical protein HBI55_191430 [Parastagonospora nodorum]|nr:hypothetical protein HBI55_191430 [Parastagonospora nodorum]